MCSQHVRSADHSERVFLSFPWCFVVSLRIAACRLNICGERRDFYQLQTGSFQSSTAGNAAASFRPLQMSFLFSQVSFRWRADTLVCGGITSSCFTTAFLLLCGLHFTLDFMTCSFPPEEVSWVEFVAPFSILTAQISFINPIKLLYRISIYINMRRLLLLSSDW